MSLFRQLTTIAPLLLVVVNASAQSYPTKPVRVIVAYPAGGSIDTTARLVAPRLNAALGQPFVVDNRSGAAGTIGTDLVAKAPPDGYTLLMGSAAAIGSAPSMYKKLPYDPMRDLAPIILIANQPNVLTVHPSVPSKECLQNQGFLSTHARVVRSMSDGHQEKTVETDDIRNDRLFR